MSRIIAGSAKGRRLAMPPHRDTRPTTDRVREAAFSLLADWAGTAGEPAARELAGLSFLGLGQAAPAPELGADSARNLSYFLQQWWIPVMPGLGVLVLALVANISGDCLRNLMKTT